jgi:hypothetical protein
MRRTIMFASLFLALPALAGAQHAGVAGGARAVAAAPHAAVAAPHVVAHAAAAPHFTGAPVGIHRTHPNGTATRSVSIASGLRNLPLFPNDGFSTFGVPGLGFDYPHLAAVGGGIRSGFFDRSRAGMGLGFGGFLLFSPGVYVEPGEEAVQPMPTPEEEAAANAPAPESAASVADQFLPYPGAPAPLPRDTSEYVFVRRDGGLLFAVGYSWDNGVLRYVTRDGVRRSVTQDMLDMNATQQFNEQRGLSFHLPA